MTPSSGGCGERLLAPMRFSSLCWWRKEKLPLASWAPDSRAGRGWGLPSNCKTQAPQILRFPEAETKAHHDSPHCSFYSYQFEVAEKQGKGRVG